MILDKCGLIGWHKIEAIILSAIVARKPILLVGPPGVAKTDSASRISRAVQGAKCSFKSYDTPALDASDLLGVFNPASLAKGEIDFIQTPLSVWGATSILLDEINCCSPLVAAKLHELIRQQEVMGLPTNVELVWAAINPPAQYQTNFMSIPLASRFVTLDVPSLADLSDEDLAKIMVSDLNKKPPKYTKKIKAARNVVLSERTTTSVQKVVTTILRQLKQSNDTIKSLEGRTAKYMYELICGFIAVKSVFKNIHLDDALVKLVISLIPEMNKAVRLETDFDTPLLTNIIREATSLLEVGPEYEVESFVELLKVEIVDELNWIKVGTSLIQNEKELSRVEKCNALVRKAKIPDHIKSTLKQQMKNHIIDICLSKGSYSTKRIKEVMDGFRM